MGDLEKMFVEVNWKILARIDELRKLGERDLSSIRTARDYFCDAIILAFEKRREDAEYKLLQALAVLKS
jgi:16S rRNA G1207 methylase RsmC